VILLGGVEPAALGRVSLANLAVLFFVASECLYLSVRSHGTTDSLVRAYLRLALLFGALPAAALTVDRSLASSAAYCSARFVVGHEPRGADAPLTIARTERVGTNYCQGQERPSR
jgi:hypothetical protein